MGSSAVSDLVKTVNADNIGQLVAAMGPELAAAVVHAMGVDLTVDLVQKLGPQVAAGIVRSAGGATTGALVRAMGADFVAELVTKLGIAQNVALVADLGPAVLLTLTTALGPVFIASLSVSLSSELFHAIFGSVQNAGAAAMGMEPTPAGGAPPRSGRSGTGYDLFVGSVGQGVGNLNLGRDQQVLAGGADATGYRSGVPVVAGSRMNTGVAADAGLASSILGAGVQQPGVKVIPAVQLTNNAASVEGASMSAINRSPTDGTRGI